MPPLPNVVVILLDTLRFDYAAKNSFLRNLAKRGWWFDRMYAPSTFTYAVMCSVRSGMYPPRHGWRTWPKGGPFRKEAIKTLEDFLSEAGYAILWNMHVPCSNDDNLYWKLLLRVSHREFFERIPCFDRKALCYESLKEKRATECPFFVFLHCWWGHHAAINKKSYGESLKEIEAFLDFVFARFTTNLFENTLWVIFSDHGRRLEESQLRLEEGKQDSGAGQVLDYRVRVPCIMIGPRIVPRCIKSAHSLVDILPTLLDLLGISHEVPEGFLPMHGHSVLRGRQSPVYLEAQSPHSIWGNKFPNVFGATDGHIKVMATPAGNWCYDLAKDPQEVNPCKELLKAKHVQDMLKFIETIRKDTID